MALAQTPILFNAGVDVLENLWRVATGKHWEAGPKLTMGSSFLKSAKGIPGNLIFAPLDVAGSAVFAKRGQVISQMAAAGGAQLVGAAIGGPIGAALGAPFGPVGAVAGELIGNVAGYAIARGPIGRGVQHLVDLGRTVRHLNFGGDYQDTEMAYSMRQVAAREMAGSLLNARQWLGQESLLLHQ